MKGIVPPHLQQKALDSIPYLSRFIVKKGKGYFDSSEGKRRLEDMLDDFFKERGKLINLIQMFIGNEKLIDKIQPEIIKFFEQSRMIDIVSDVGERVGKSREMGYRENRGNDRERKDKTMDYRKNG